jgi:hypothetical protein
LLPQLLSPIKGTKRLAKQIMLSDPDRHRSSRRRFLFYLYGPALFFIGHLDFDEIF